MEELRSVPDADLALTQLGRFLDAAHARAQIYAVLQEHRPILQLLTRILGTSRFLGEILIREPLLFEQLTYASWVEERVEEVAVFRHRLEEAVAGGTGPAPGSAALSPGGAFADWNP
ncbi:MAG: hypothetical protein KatS3mg115_0269 [Candidatus Poribacteria bacterium]|nr:MAG: hypothetical protein KatS3mg115_0269 [Candidatus Poribacteria bacterium]